MAHNPSQPYTLHYLCQISLTPFVQHMADTVPDKFPSNVRIFAVTVISRTAHLSTQKDLKQLFILYISKLFLKLWTHCRVLKVARGKSTKCNNCNFENSKKKNPRNCVLCENSPPPPSLLAPSFPTVVKDLNNWNIHYLSLHPHN